jgi:aldehyde:ferredoxin oxidoreductase
MGIDTMTTGSIIGFAYELYERGIISSADTGGIELVYGDDRAMIRLVNLIGRREGFGNILAEGIIRAAKLIGKNASDYAIHVKGLDPGAYEPRGAKSLGLNYATGSIGASHCYGYSMQELFGRAEPRKADRFADTGTGDLAAYNQDRQALIELGIVCMFPAWGSWLKELYPGMLAAATGDHSFAEYEYLRLAAERTYNLERLFNLGCGLKRSDDNLPARFTKEPQEPTGGPADGQMMGQLETLLDEYYQARGWDGNGIPTEQTLTRLGIKRL